LVLGQVHSDSNAGYVGFKI